MKVKSLSFVLFVLMLGMNAKSQVTPFTQTTTNDFLMGTGLNVNIADNSVSLQNKMVSLADWSPAVNLPQTLQGHQMVIWRNNVYLVGGANSSGAVTGVHRAAKQSDGISSWTALNEMPVALRDAAVVATQTQLVVMGGRNSEGVSDKIYVAHLNDNGNIGSWTESSLILPQPLWGARAVSVMDNIYIVGGATADDDSSVSDKVYHITMRADGEMLLISETNSLPLALNGHAIATYDSKIVVVGGYDENHTIKNTVYSAAVNSDGSIGSWTQCVSLPTPVYNHSMLSANGKLWILGGHDGYLASDNIYIADADADNYSWTLSDIFIAERNTNGAAFAFGDKIFYAGGQALSGALRNSVNFLQVNTGSDYVTKSSFVGIPIYVGTPKNLQSISCDITFNEETTEYELLYRIAGADMIFSDWISGGQSSNYTINEQICYVQFMYRMTANGSDNVVINSISANISGLTPLSGDLSSIGNINLSGSPYLVTDDIYFNSGTHNIQAGVVIYFARNTGMTIGEASVNFEGTPDHPILLTFMGDESGQWNGVYYQDNSDYGSLTSTMSYTTIEKAGYGDNNANLRLYKTNNPTIIGCNFNNAEGHGVRLNGESYYYSSPTITNSNMNGNSECGIYIGNKCSPNCSGINTENNKYGIYVYNNDCNPVFTNVSVLNNTFGFHSGTPNRSFIFDGSDISFVGNDTDIAVDGNDSSSPYFSDQTWNYYANGYAVLGTVNVFYYYSNNSNNPKLTIAAGNTLKFKEGCQLKIGYNNSESGGMLYAVGTQDNPITFTSYNGEVGGWDGLYFANGSDYNSTSTLRYCTIEKAINNVQCYYTTQPSVKWCTLRDAQNDNFWLNSSNINVESSNVENARYGMYLYNDSRPVLIYNTFNNHSVACVYENSTDSYGTYYGCTMRNSNIGIRYSTPNKDISTVTEIAFENNYANEAIPGGTISGSYNWGANTYYIMDNLYVDNSSSYAATLTLTPGSTLKFAENTGLNVSYISGSSYLYKGVLLAEGTESQPITFTSMNGENGGWNGLLFGGNSSSYSYCSAIGNESVLKHCVIEKGNEYNVRFNYPMPQLQIENCTFRDAAGYGVYFHYVPNTPITMSNNLFENNSRSAVYCNSPNYVGHYENNVFTGNLNDGVGINGGTTSKEMTWDNLGEGYAYYLFNSNITVDNRLTLLPGCTMKFNGNGMYVNNELIAEGIETEPITFTSKNGESGGWTGLYFSSSSANYHSILKHCIIENGNGYNIYLYYTTQPSLIENCKLSNSYGVGLYLYNSSINLSKTIIKDNAGVGIRLEGYSNPVVSGCDILGNNNGGYQIYCNANSSYNVNMSHNFFGSFNEDYIYKDLVYDKTENSSYGIVNISPVSHLPHTVSSHAWNGHIYYDFDENKPMSNCVVKIKDFDDNVLAQQMVAADGSFTFDSLYDVPTKIDISTTDGLAGVNSTDALLVMRHFTQLQQLEGDYLNVADVNGSKNVNGTDALLIQRRSVNMINELPVGDEYMSAKNVDFGDNAFGMDIDFLWYGDVNGSFTPSSRGNDIELQSEGKIVAESYQRINLPVKVNGFGDLGAMTLNFSYPEEYVSIENVTFNGDNLLFNVENGKVKTSWFNLHPMSVVNESVLLNFEVMTKDLSCISEPLVLSLDSSSELADSEGKVISGVVLTMPGVVTKEIDNDENTSITLYPNPMKDKAVISYYLPESTSVTLIVYSITGGKVAQIVDGHQDGGKHDVEINKTMIPGVYFCHLNYGDETKVVKFVVE